MILILGDISVYVLKRFIFCNFEMCTETVYINFSSDTHQMDDPINSALLATENAQLKEEIERLKTLSNEKDTLLKQCHNNSIKSTLKIGQLKKRIKILKEKNFSYSLVKKNVEMHHFYTGIKSEAFSDILTGGNFHLVCKKLKIADHLLLVLMKLRLGLSNRDLAYRFNVSFSVVSKIYRQLLPKLSTIMLNFYSWPEKIALRGTLPKCFKKYYAHCVCIIDCTEIFIERPLNLNARAQTWSNYKNHNTIKYLVSCSPTGSITFLSDGWGGRVSDKEITIKSGFLDLIEHGDQVLADRGFTVEEEVASVGGILEIPSFTRGKKQLSSKEVGHSRQIANVRIHIERVIGRMRKFNILNTIIPLSQVDFLNHVMISIGGLVNINKKIVS